jgi:hypothetical protein
LSSQRTTTHQNQHPHRGNRPGAYVPHPPFPPGTFTTLTDRFRAVKPASAGLSCFTRSVPCYPVAYLGGEPPSFTWDSADRPPAVFAASSPGACRERNLPGAVRNSKSGSNPRSEQVQTQNSVLRVTMSARFVPATLTDLPSIGQKRVGIGQKEDPRTYGRLTGIRRIDGTGLSPGHEGPATRARR